MSRSRSLAAALLWMLACEQSPPDEPGESSPPGATPVVPDELTAAAREDLPEDALEAERRKLDASHPLHGAVTATEVRVHERPDPESPVVGWLRVGASVRLAEPEQGAGCRGGFHPIHPTGYVCAADAIEVRDAAITLEPPSDEGWKNDQGAEAAARGALVLPPPARDEALPYDYYFVKEPTVPAYHRLPSRNEQRAALAKSERYLELLENDEKRAARYLSGESDDGPRGTEVTARYLDRGFFVASNGSEVRAFRRFVRTTQGRYIKQAQLEDRKGHDFRGVEVDAGHPLPVAWTVRTSRLLIAEPNEDGTFDFREDEVQEPIERQTLLTHWRGLRRMGGPIMHLLETPQGPRYLRSWFAAVANELPRPREVKAGRPWVHVDTRQQTAVLYDADGPVYATLVSSGIEGHETPVGVFEIRRKRVTDTMADLGPEAGSDRYRVEDVPWTQYFEGSYALHAAFWHTRFGIQRSHGCVNLSPVDAHRIFKGTLPEVPTGWHGLSTEGTRFRGSFVVVTDEDLNVLGDPRERGKEQAGEDAEEEVADEDEDETAEDEPPADDGEEDADETEEAPQTYGIGATARSVEPWQRRQPDEVTYTIQRGGSARFVANLFGLFHHEMQELNPSVDLDEELPPDTELVVYRHDPAVQSRSIGYPSHGSVEGGAPLPDGTGRILKATPRKLWATRRTVALLDSVLRAWPRVEPHADPLLVGNMSTRKGGKLSPHHTHQSGRDVDLGYPQIRDPNEVYNWRDMGEHNLDARRTWRLLHLLYATGGVEVVLMDRSLQKLLYDFARSRKLLSDEELGAWLEYPRPTGKGSPRVQHVAGHVDHLHVRFDCGGQAGCQSRRGE